jgi:hypothetical protein
MFSLFRRYTCLVAHFFMLGFLTNIVSLHTNLPRTDMCKAPAGPAVSREPNRSTRRSPT